MPDYTSKYVFEAHARGFSEVNRQMDQTMAKIRELKGMGDVNVGASGASSGTSSGGSSGGGTSQSASSSSSQLGLFPDARHLARAVAYAGAISMVYSAMQLGVEVANRWTDAQVQANRVMIDAQVTLGGTQSELANFVAGVKQLAYASGEAYSEASLVARRETLLNRPGMGANAAALNMVFPSLDLSTSAEDITAIQTQFRASFTDINDVLLALVQTSGLTADELLSMSETWGALVDDMKLGDRSLTTMKEIGALMGAMSVTMGESGTVIEQFLRKLERIYTDDKVTAALESTGIAVRDVNGQFRSLTDILDDISSRGMGDEVYNALQGFFPNDLGQKTKQQLREMFNNVDLITAAVQRATEATADFDSAVVTASQSLDNIGEKLNSAFDNWLSSIGNISGASSALLELSSGLQNASGRFSGTNMGRAGYDAITGDTPGPLGMRYAQSPQTKAAIDEITSLMLSMIADPSLVERTDKLAISRQMFSNLPSDFFGNITDPTRQLDYLRQAIGMFNQSPYRVEGAGPETSVQNFLLYMSQHADEVNRAFVGIRDSTTMDQEAFAGHTTAVNDAIVAMTAFTSAAYIAAGDLVNAARFSATPGGMLRERLSLTEQRDAVAMASTMRDATPPAPTLASGYAALAAAYTPEDRAKGQQRLDDMIAQSAIDRFNRENLLAEQAARQQQSAWQSTIDKVGSMFSNMISSITKPTPVTGTDLYYNGPNGTYKDKWDEPMRQFGADINHLIAGEPLQYPDATAMFSQFLPPDVMAYAAGADEETKKSIFQGALSAAQTPYYNLEMDASAYNFDALVPAAQQWMTGQANRKTNLAEIGKVLEANGLGPGAQGFLDLLDTPPIITSLTGGKSAAEISDQMKGYVPDIATTVKDQFVDMNWVMIIGGSMKASIDADSGPLKEAGKAAAGPFAEGFADPVAGIIIAKIVAALASFDI